VYHGRSGVEDSRKKLGSIANVLAFCLVNLKYLQVSLCFDLGDDSIHVVLALHFVMGFVMMCKLDIAWSRPDLSHCYSLESSGGKFSDSLSHIQMLD